MLKGLKEDFDEGKLQAALSRLSDDDLAALEDDLDFCNFTGVPSVRVLKLLKDIVDLDAGWNNILEKGDGLKVPSAY